MQMLNALRKNPVAVLFVAVAGIAGWVAAGLFSPQQPPPNPLEIPDLGLAKPTVTRFDPTHESRPVSPEALPKLKPGMKRVEVEGVIGLPSADALQPVTVLGGRMTYQAAYELAEPDPSTVRPIQHHGRMIPVPPSAKSHFALEYDASKPGHPLLAILYLDPLF
jgi:hypothetical protein